MEITITRFILGPMLIILGAMYLSISIGGLFVVLFGLFVIYNGFLFRKIANNEISTDRPDNCVNTAKNRKFEWSPTLYVNDFLEVDEVNKKFAIFEPRLLKDNALVCILNYKDLLSYQIFEDDTEVIKSKFGLGSWLASELIYGEEHGAIVGSILAERVTIKRVYSLKIKINVRGTSIEPVYINIINSKLDSDGFAFRIMYDLAQQIIDILEKIKNEVETNQGPFSNTSDSIANEIRKYKILFDEGVISEEEFKAKKKQLLNT